MASEENYERFAFLTFDDIQKVNQNSDDILVAVKAPLGSKIEVLIYEE